MGLTNEGYIRRSYQDILDSKIQRAKELFGEDIDTSDLTPLGKFIRISAYDLAIVEEEAEAIYYARFPNTASGQSLDRLAVFGGLSRNQATPASYTVEVEGTADHEIEAGFLVGTDTDLTFYCTQNATIGTDGTCEIEVSCTEPGTLGNINAGSINRVVNPDAHISAVNGVEIITPGVDTESDAELRARLVVAFAGAGSGNENAIRAAVLRVPTVRYATVIANNTDEDDEDGRPPHSFETYVLGGDDYETEIAEAIFDKRPVGIQTVGTKTVTILDICGESREIKFSLAQNVTIDVKVQIKITTAYESDGAEQIRQNVAEHINGLGIGNTLEYTSIYGHVYKVAGVKAVTSLMVSTDGGTTYSSVNVDIDKHEIAICGDVTVEVVAQ